jgi:hypothetical protein
VIGLGLSAPIKFNLVTHNSVSTSANTA